MAAIPPNQTIYIRNLNDHIKKDVLKQSLYGLCIAYGQVLDVVALKTMKMRGQAFVVFSDITAATAALRQLNGRQIFGKPMQIEYALSKSNKAAQLDGTFRFDQPHQQMSARKRKELLGIANKRPIADTEQEEQAAKRREIEHDMDESDEEVGPQIPTSDQARPNTTLFVSNFPKSVSQETLTELFRQYDGFKELRLAEGKAGVAFVDYLSPEAAAAARDVLDGFKISPRRAIKVEFSR
ncbi:U2 small nuclear ribonucleoprotein B'' [Coemansia sp. RSA 2336]|nr:U2 small nuclear ribonucleoprotein B'' [Coemansia sp. RSA 2336]